MKSGSAVSVHEEDAAQNNVANGAGREQLHPHPGNAHQSKADPDAGAKKGE